jgi:hypothetical protein
MQQVLSQMNTKAQREEAIQQVHLTHYITDAPCYTPSLKDITLQKICCAFLQYITGSLVASDVLYIYS